MKVTHIVVHYSATFRDEQITAATIDKWHKERGFKGIGYHFFYRLNGKEEVGRTLNEQGAHVRGKNKGKIGLCFAGGLDRSTGPDVGVNTMNLAQEKALISRIRFLKVVYPDAIICGHKDLVSTQCPGFDVGAWWDEVVKNGYKPVFNKEKAIPGIKALKSIVRGYWYEGR